MHPNNITSILMILGALFACSCGKMTVESIRVTGQNTEIDKDARTLHDFGGVSIVVTGTIERIDKKKRTFEGDKKDKSFVDQEFVLKNVKVVECKRKPVIILKNSAAVICEPIKRITINRCVSTQCSFPHRQQTRMKLDHGFKVGKQIRVRGELGMPPVHILDTLPYLFATNMRD